MGFQPSAGGNTFSTLVAVPDVCIYAYAPLGGTHTHTHRSACLPACLRPDRSASSGTFLSLCPSGQWSLNIYAASAICMRNLKAVVSCNKLSQHKKIKKGL